MSATLLCSLTTNVAATEPTASHTHPAPATHIALSRSSIELTVMWVSASYVYTVHSRLILKNRSLAYEFVTKRHCNNQSERSFQIGPIRAWRNVSIQPIRQQEANLSADGAQDGGGQLHAAKLTLLIANCLQIMVFQSVLVGKPRHNTT